MWRRSKYQTMEQVSNAQARLGLVRAVGNIPRYLNSERGFSTNILFGPAVVDPKTARRARRQVSQADRRRRRQDEPGPGHHGRRLRRRRHDRRPDRRAERPVQGAAHRDRHRDRRPGGDPPRRRQEDRRRQFGVQRRGHHAARRAGPPDRVAERRGLPPGHLRQRRLDAARRRRPQFQPAQEHRRRQPRRDRGGADRDRPARRAPPIRSRRRCWRCAAIPRRRPMSPPHSTR